MHRTLTRHDYTGVNASTPIDWTAFANSPPEELRPKLQIIYNLSKHVDTVDRALTELTKMNDHAAELYVLSEPTEHDFAQCREQKACRIAAPDAKVVTLYQFEIRPGSPGLMVFNSHRLRGLWLHPDRPFTMCGHVLTPRP